MKCPIFPTRHKQVKLNQLACDLGTTIDLNILNGINTAMLMHFNVFMLANCMAKE